MLDESIYGLADIERAADEGACRFVKVKLMKLVSLDAPASHARSMPTPWRATRRIGCRTAGALRMRTIVTGAIGADTHIVGNRILSRNGYLATASLRSAASTRSRSRWRR